MHYLQGLQSDIYKQSVTLLNNSFFSPTLQILTELIRCKYNLKYDEAVYIFLHERYHCHTKNIMYYNQCLKFFNIKCNKHISNIGGVKGS